MVDRGTERTRIRGDNENHAFSGRDLHSEFASRQRSALVCNGGDEEEVGTQSNVMLHSQDRLGLESLEENLEERCRITGVSGLEYRGLRSSRPTTCREGKHP